MYRMNVEQKFEEKPRWPGAPKICLHANLPAFLTWGDASAFNDSLGSKAIQLKWNCWFCGYWHYWSKESAPAGQSSGTTRESPVPDRIIQLSEETAPIIQTP
jgi:hypothetical protein